MVKVDVDAVYASVNCSEDIVRTGGGSFLQELDKIINNRIGKYLKIDFIFVRFSKFKKSF